MMRLELTTFSMARRRSSQLSYIRVGPSLPRVSEARPQGPIRLLMSLWISAAVSARL
jgi:hypothetical protein